MMVVGEPCMRCAKIIDSCTSLQLVFCPLLHTPFTHLDKWGHVLYSLHGTQLGIELRRCCSVQAADSCLRLRRHLRSNKRDNKHSQPCTNTVATATRVPGALSSERRLRHL